MHHSKPSQLHCLSQGLSGLSEGTKFHSERLEWLAQAQKSYQATSPDWLFSHIKLRLTLLELYQDYFPYQWQHSTKSTEVVSLESHTERELEFFDLLDEFRFPCERACEEFYDSLVVYAIKPDWTELSWDELDCLLHCYIALTDESCWEQLVKVYQLEGSDLQRPASVKKVTAARLKNECDKLNSPLRYLAEAFNLIEYNSDNVWIDSNDMDPFNYEWCHENIERLTQEYETAKVAIEHFNALNDWLSTNPERIKALVRVWNAAANDPDNPYQQLELPFVTTINSTDFVRGEWLRELRETRRHYEQLVYG